MKPSTEFFRQNLAPLSMRRAARLLGIAIVVGMTLTAISSQAAQLYISPTGLDSHPCSQALPCLTLQHAVNVASNGDTIHIEPGTYAESETSISNKNLTILGAGASHSILQGLGSGGAAPVMQIFQSSVTVSGVTITQGGESAVDVLFGTLILESSVVSNSFGFVNSRPPRSGGGINNVQGVLTLKGTMVTNNQSTDGLGGGIDNIGGVIFITESTISANSANTDTGGGGGIYNDSGLITVSQSTISGNSALIGGGGGINNNGLITVSQSTISGNLGGNGGGIASGGIVQVLNSTIAGNRTNISNGGGISAGAGSVELNNTTVADNFSEGTGGGLYLFNLNSSTESTAVVVTAGNTILALNRSKFGLFFVENDCTGGQLLSSGYNLFGSLGNCSLFGPGPDRTNVNPNLGPLQNNGGPTETMLPLTGSPAIDAGNPAGCMDPFGNKLTVDQRGLPRPDADDTRCDVGAVEVQQ